MKKLLLYIDQSFLSTMVKEDLGLIRDHNAVLGEKMRALLSLTQELVDRDKVLCPMSAVHQDETGQDDRLEHLIYRILNELSDGISFYETPSIEHRQTIRALQRYLGLSSDPEDGRWEHAFSRNPHKPIDRPRVYAHISRPVAFARDIRRRKERIREFQERHFPHHRLPSDTLASYRRDQLVGVIRLFYANPLLDYAQRLAEEAGGISSQPRLSATATDDERVDFLNRTIPPPAVDLATEYSAIAGTPWFDPGDKYWAFFMSPCFEAVPYWDIYTSLQAGLFFYKPNRRPRPSDHYDMAAMATALPYVDLVTTDAMMKEMLGSLGLDKKYGVEVYSPRLQDVKALIQRLSQLQHGDENAPSP